MSTVCEQLVHAYRQEEQLYLRIMELVNRQHTVMNMDGDAGQVLQLCGEVEKLLDDVAVIEKAIAPPKKLWEQGERDGEAAELDAVLATIQGVIEQTAAAQEQVRVRLMQYMDRSKSTTQEARSSLRANRAQVAYHSG